VNIIEFNLELTATVASLAAIRRDIAAEPSGRSILIDIRAPWILLAAIMLIGIPWLVCRMRDQCL